jgi:hypothetical protein
MYQLFDTLHSYNRYLLMAALLFVLFRSYSGWLNNKRYEKPDNIGSAALTGLTHLQLLLGLILYFISPFSTAAMADMKSAMKSEWLRYFGVEHITVMIIAVVCIQVARTLTKRSSEDINKHRKTAIWVSVATILILLSLLPKGLLFGSADGSSVN